MTKRLIRTVLGIMLILGVTGCGEQTTATDQSAATTTAGASHGHSPAGNSAVPYDAQFIDGMIEHHRGAVAMAEQAIKESERPEIKQLAQNIITSQRQEIEQMTGWRERWYPDLPATGGTGMAMGDMSISADAGKPFDQRFIAAMVSHHQGAIAMAQEAKGKAEHAEIKQLADAIITAQTAEVAQLQQWNREWFGG